MVAKEEKFGLLLRIVEIEAGAPASALLFRVFVETPSGKGKKLFGNEKKLFGDEKKAVFVPSERVNELVKSGELRAGVQIGSVNLSFFHVSKQIHWSFFPFSRGFREGREIDLLEGHGIATLIQAAVVAMIRKEKRFAGYKMYHSIVRTKRQRQLERMGIAPSVFYPLEEHWQKTRDYARELAKKHSKRRKPK